MKYIGSKYLIWNKIENIVLQDYGEQYFNYVEPFCGGCNSLYQVKNIDGGKRIASDINPYLISLFKGLLENKKVFYPISKELYLDAKQEYKNGRSDKYSVFDLAWIGYMASFRGSFFGYYTGNNVKSKIDSRPNTDYIDEAIKNILKQLDGLRDVIFECCSYDKLIIPRKSIIYCDPPYRNTTKYKHMPDFDYEKFYDWCFKEFNRGNKVFISEYSLPDCRFTEIWRGETKCTLNYTLNNGVVYNKIEKLYTIK